MLLFCLSPLLLPPFSGGLPYVASVHMYDQLLRGLFNGKKSSYNNNNKSHLLSTCWIFDIYWLMSSSQFRGVINGRTFSRSELMSGKARIGMHLRSTPKSVLHFSLQQAASIRASGLSNSTSSHPACRGVRWNGQEELLCVILGMVSLWRVPCFLTGLCKLSFPAWLSMQIDLPPPCSSWGHSADSCGRDACLLKKSP